MLSPSYTVTIQAPIQHDPSRFETDGKIGVHRDASGWNKINSSINTMSHDAPRVSARFIYGPTTTHDGSTTIHHGGATNAHDASTIRYGASTIQAGSATVASRPPTNLHDLVVVMRQSQGVWGGWGYSHFFFIRRHGPSIYHTPPPPPKKKKTKKKPRNFENPPPPKKKFEIIATPQIPPFCTLTLKKTQKCIEITLKYSLILWWSP